MTAEGLAGLRPAFGRDGIITAASSSPISDGAAPLVVASADAAATLGLPVLARIGAYGQVAGPDSFLQRQPARAIEAAARKQGVEVADLDLIEINEAFAAVGIASARALGLSADDVEERVNVHGGAIASATRSARPVRAWSCTWRTSCSGGGAARPSPRCAVAAARAMP